ncbi:MAG: TetR/AcrR family transcriptional regulator [Paracoccaceae bacterium]
MSRKKPDQPAVLHRDDPEKEPLVGNVKVTRRDWLNAAMDVLINDGVDQVKVLVLATRLGVSRSSFYWYFKSRQDLLNALLQEWQNTNTAVLVAKANAPAETITGALCNVFHCVVDPSLFNTSLDFAIRAWARGSPTVRRVQDQSDAVRLTALADMYRRFGYEDLEAVTRARILYFMQMGYNDADLNEPMDERIKHVPMYLLGFTGKEARPEEIGAFRDYVDHVTKTQAK